MFGWTDCSLSFTSRCVLSRTLFPACRDQLSLSTQAETGEGAEWNGMDAKIQSRRIDVHPDRSDRITAWAVNFRVQTMAYALIRRDLPAVPVTSVRRRSIYILRLHLPSTKQAYAHWPFVLACSLRRPSESCLGAGEERTTSDSAGTVARHKANRDAERKTRRARLHARLASKQATAACRGIRLGGNRETNHCC